MKPLSLINTLSNSDPNTDVYIKVDDLFYPIDYVFVDGLDWTKNGYPRRCVIIVDTKKAPPSPE